MLLAAALVLVALVPGTLECPHHCKCLWRASKITVDCSGAMHTQVPGMETSGDTQVTPSYSGGCTRRWLALQKVYV